MLHDVGRVSAVPLSRKVRTMRQTAGNTQGARTAMILLRTSGYLSLPQDRATIVAGIWESHYYLTSDGQICWKQDILLGKCPTPLAYQLKKQRKTEKLFEHVPITMQNQSASTITGCIRARGLLPLSCAGL